MPLTKDIIKEQAALQSLTDEQLQALEKLSANSEQSAVNEAIATKTREMWDRLDADIKQVFGKDKPREVKSWELLKQTLTEAKVQAEKASEIEGNLSKLQAEKKLLEDQLKDGDKSGLLSGRIEKLEQQIKDRDQQLEALKSQVQEKENEYKTQLEQERDKLDRFEFEKHIDSALQGVQFKAEIPESIRETYIRTAKEKVLSQYKRDWMERDGQRIPIFRDDQGNIVTNPKNLQEPFKPQELFLTEIKDVLNEGSKGSGGTKPTGASQGKSVAITGNPRTKSEATQLIRESLMKQGIAADSDEYHTKMQQAYSEMNVSELPLK